MPTARKASTLADPFKLTLLILAIIAFMYFAGEVLKPLALSVLLTFALVPAVRFLERRGLPTAAASALTVAVALGLLAATGLVVGQQLTALANHLPDYQDNIEAKISGLIKPGQESAADKLQTMADRVTAKLDDRGPGPGAAGPGKSSRAAEPVPLQKVEVVSQPTFQERLRSTTGPYLEFLGVGSFVLILVLFMLVGREDLGDRIVGLFGHRQVSLTTRTMDEIGRRITRYLATFALVNSGFGLVIGLGLWAIGVPYAVLWGCLAAMLRFIPYVGPAVSFLLPLVFSFAHFPGWAQPLEVFALFAVVEVALNSFLEPIIYGKTTGVSALGLLVAAMFWTWLWGTVGLLLSTPLTLCLAVLGKYVPSLGFFATMLGEDADLDPDVRLYQKLLALDREGAVELVEEEAKTRRRVEVFDEILVRALARAERDAERDELDEAGQAFAWNVVGDVLDGLETVPIIELGTPAAPAAGTPAPAPIPIVALAVDDTSDALVLRMLGQLLGPAYALEIVTDTESPLQVAERVAELSPRLVVISHLPPEGMTLARYLVRRLRAQFAEMPIWVGRWAETGGSASAAGRLVQNGATGVVFSLAEMRDCIIEATAGARNPEVAAASLAS